MYKVFLTLSLSGWLILAFLTLFRVDGIAFLGFLWPWALGSFAASFVLSAVLVARTRSLGSLVLLAMLVLALVSGIAFYVMFWH